MNQNTNRPYQNTNRPYQNTNGPYQNTNKHYQNTNNAFSKYQRRKFIIPTFKFTISKYQQTLSKYQWTLWSCSKYQYLKFIISKYQQPYQNTNRPYDHVHNTNPNPGTPNEQSWYCKHEEWMNEWNELKVKFSWFAFAIGNETLTISPIQYLHILEGHQMLSLDVLSSLIFSGAEWIHCSRFCIILWSKMNCIC